MEFDLFELKKGESLEAGKTKKVTDDFIIEYKWTEMKKAIGIPDVIVIASQVINIIKFAHWLYNKLKNRNVVKLRINGIEVAINEEKIKEILKQITS